MDERLRAELLELAAADQAFRRRWSTLSQEEISAEYALELARSARIAAIVEERGWPGRSLVGDDGASAAWLLVQHADHDVELQERCLELLRDAVASGEARRQDLAYLTDRVCVNRGRPQRYGTQFHGRGDDFGPRPIADPERLDDRRAEAGLPPFAEYEAEMRELEDRE